MKSTPNLRIVNDVPSQTQDSGVSIKTVVFIAALTSIAGLLAADGYRYAKKKFHEKRKELASNPNAFSWPSLPGFGGSDREPNPRRSLTQEDLQEWEKSLEEREERLRAAGD